MPRPCLACVHPERATLDRLLVEGTAASAVAARYGLHERGLRRHAAHHLPAALAAAQDAATVTRGDDLLARLQAINADTTAILSEAKRAKDYDLALRAIARVEKQLELEARLLGELRDGATVNVFVGPEWQQAVSALLGALASHPEARIAAAGALRALSAGMGAWEGQEVAHAP